MAATVSVLFPRGDGHFGRRPAEERTYHYMTDIDLAVGDDAVVSTAYGPKVVRVVEVDPEDGPLMAADWVVCRVDYSRYDARRGKVKRKI